MANSTIRHISTEPAYLSNKGEGGKKTRGVRVIATAKGSDSDNSGETNSLSAESGDLRPALPLPTASQRKHRNNRRRGSEWEVLEGLKDGQRFDRRPEVFNGFLHKKRKWPLKGWHKRYFVVDAGILVYARSPSDISRGRLHGSVDIGLSVISAKARRRRIDIDAEEFIYHLRAKTPECFHAWVTMLKAHRLYRQHFLTFGAREPTVVQVVQDEDVRRQSWFLNGLGQERENSTLSRPRGSLVNTTSGGRLASWIIDSGVSLEGAAKELGQAQLTLQQLSQLLAILEAAGGSQDGDINLEGSSPSVKKDRKKFGLRKKKSGSSKGGSVDLGASGLRVDTEPQGALSLTSLSLGAPPSPQGTLSASAHSLAAPSASLPLTAARPQSLPGPEHLTGPSGPMGITPDQHAREDFTILAKDITATLKGILTTLATERDRLKVIIDLEPSSSVANAQSTAGSSNTMVATLRSNLNSALQQNAVGSPSELAELKSRLARIHDASDIAEISSAGPPSEIAVRPFHTSHSYSSSCVSASEFFDAEDLLSLDGQTEAGEIASGVIELEGDTSSEAGSLTSEEGSVSSDNSEPPTDISPLRELSVPSAGGQGLTGRRTRLPATRPDTEGLSLWNLLCKNIGKDLSQVSMPVTINEPLNMLQRLCEELEYSELLEVAAAAPDPVERMTLVAAFAVSAYGPTRHRAASKPFNPLLGETYECVREDRGFRFLAEQVSHHPPVSACYAESKGFQFWQEARIRTKFWGKSMEFQPASTVHLTLTPTNDHYVWNKVTTCVHNLFGGQRWVDQYGELKITNEALVCKLTFVKASYWSAKRHEVHGSITTSDGKVLRKLFGRWSEALFCGHPPAAKCIWRPGTMPEDFELYYGFTSFAMELNELDPELAKVLPCTDTRFRPDQRALEQGNIDTAETLKLQLEQAQRERRKKMEEDNVKYVPKWFSKSVTENGDEYWQYSGKYWETRRSPGFNSVHMDRLW
ncbi:oxysterol-binding protein-related protein 6-like isoform X2 [Arctopsyche grandis]|uniref:oxysterol-binding protein-related protein 6-like isoform X2 n=1 Tax=Arctopsyche grandis TaxID=121162 RepID=UPI00406D6B5A